MLFDNRKFEKIKWDKLKIGFDFDGNFTDVLYKKISKDARKKIEAFVWDNAIIQIRKYIGAKEKEFKCRDGQQFNYLDIGNPDREIFLYLHGFGDTKESVYSLAKSLSNRFRVIIPDIPGFGDSVKIKELTYNLESYSVWFKEFIMSELGGKVHVMGNSLGGGIALKLAIEEPSVLKSMALLNAAGVVPKHSESIYDELNRGENIFAIDNMKDFDRFISRIVFDVPLTPPPLRFQMYNNFKENRDWYNKLLGDINHGFGKNFDRKTLIDGALNESIAGIKIPTLIVWGEADSLFPLEVAAILHTQITTSKLVVFEKVGHIPQLEVPKKLLKRYVTFLDSLPVLED